MTVLTVNIGGDKSEKALKALMAVADAFDMQYDIEDDISFTLSEEQKKEILRRETEYKAGNMKLYSLDEVKKVLSYKG